MAESATKIAPDKICYYCGLPASTIDHVIPRAILGMYDKIADPDIYEELIRRRTLTVPACRECNNLAGATYQKNLQERKKYIKEKLRKRYKKYLKMPDWKEDEIAELGYSLQQEVRAGLNNRELIKQRLVW